MSPIHAFELGAAVAASILVFLEAKFGFSIGGELKEYVLRFVGKGEAAKASAEARLRRLAGKLVRIKSALRG